MGYQTRGGGPPGWFVFLLGVAFVFGIFYLWTNLQAFVATGRISINEATAISESGATSTAVSSATIAANFPTRRPTSTPKPPCQTFIVVADSAIMRSDASTRSTLLESLARDTEVCVLGTEEGDDGFVWYFIDRDAITRLIEGGYMREDVILPLNPTATPTDTNTPFPTITQTYTPTRTPTPDGAQPVVVTPSSTSRPLASSTPRATPTPNRVDI
ncbi:MAG: hypothetical protein AAFR81_05665 [Chloroflexota bacterium]